MSVKSARLTLQRGASRLMAQVAMAKSISRAANGATEAGTQSGVRSIGSSIHWLTGMVF